MLTNCMHWNPIWTFTHIKLSSFKRQIKSYPMDYFSKKNMWTIYGQIFLLSKVFEHFLERRFEEWDEILLIIFLGVISIWNKNILGFQTVTNGILLFFTLFETHDNCNNIKIIDDTQIVYLTFSRLLTTLISLPFLRIKWKVELSDQWRFESAVEIDQSSRPLKYRLWKCLTQLQTKR